MEQKNWMIEGFESLEGKHYDFKQYLTDQEMREFEIDEKQLRDQEMDMIRKYAKVTGDRITKDTLIKTIVDAVSVTTLENIAKYLPRTTDVKFEWVGQGEDKKYEGIKTDKDPNKMLLDLLAVEDCKTLQAILNVLHMIELPTKESNAQ